MPIRQSIMPAVVTCLLLTSTAAMAHDPRDVVRDNDGRVVLNTYGNCVHTDWVSGSHACEAKRVEHVVSARGLENEARTVYFEFNKSRIMPSEQHKLDSLAEVLKGDTSVQNASIVGYADRIGSTAYNQRLSERRAKAVENYLHQRGYLNTSLAEVRWLGESAPVTSCPNNLARKDLIACLQKDRRVEVEIQFNDGADTHPHKVMDHNPR